MKIENQNEKLQNKRITLMRIRDVIKKQNFDMFYDFTDIHTLESIKFQLPNLANIIGWNEFSNLGIEDDKVDQLYGEMDMNMFRYNKLITDELNNIRTMIFDWHLYNLEKLNAVEYYCDDNIEGYGIHLNECPSFILHDYMHPYKTVKEIDYVLE